MPQPTAGDVHVNAALTNISVAYIQSAEGFVADKVFPIVPVDQQSNFYYTYTQNDWFRDEAKPRSPGAESAGGGFSLSTATYSAVVEAWHEDVADQIRANSDAMINLDASATELVTQRLMIRRERRWMTQYFGTGIWGTDATPSNLWDTATGDPVADVDTAKSTIAGNTGMVPNTMVVSYPVFLKLRNNVRVRDQFKYTSADSINEAMLARLFDVQRFLVAKAVYASNKEGATAAYSFMAGKHALVCYVPPSPGLLVPSAGYIFAWSGYVGAKNGMRIKRFREEGKAADRIEGELAYDMKKVAANLGYFLNGVMS